MLFTASDRIRLIVSLDDVQLSGEQGQPSRVELQLAVAGQFVSGRYGRFAIAERDFDEMIGHYGTVYPLNPTELCVDYDHLSTPDPDKPRTPGDGRASGWIKRIYKKATTLSGKSTIGLFAEIEWTPPAAELIRSKQYRFFSPTFVKQWVTNTGKKIGATLLGGALTNHPFLHGMNAVTLSGELAIPYTGASMATIKTKDKNGAEVEIELSDLEAVPEVKAHFTPKPAPIADPAPAAAPAPAPAAAGQPSADVAQLSSQIATLVGTVSTLSQSVAQMQTQQVQTQFERDFDVALRAGKVLPAEKDTLKQLSAQSYQLFTQIVGARPDKMVKLGVNHGSSDIPETTDTDAKDNDALQSQFDTKVSEYATTHKLSYADALSKYAATPEGKTIAEQLRASFRE